MPRVLVTGGSGLVGSAVVKDLINAGFFVVAPSRKPLSISSPGLLNPPCGDIDDDLDWLPMLSGVDAIVHCAARVHVMKDAASNPAESFHRTNVQATIRLAKSALIAGVKRFVFISSIKVNGESTSSGQKFSADGPNFPADHYASSKSEAECELLRLAASSSLEIVIVRPPLVYGPGVKANFLAMLRWAEKGIPLPLASVKNKRTLVGVKNLANFIMVCLLHPAAKNQIFLVGDRDPVSTPELLRVLGKAFGKSVAVYPFPVCVLRCAAFCVGRSNLMTRLCESLELDISKAKNLLGWEPPFSMQEEIARTVSAYKKSSDFQ